MGFLDKLGLGNKDEIIEKIKETKSKMDQRKEERKIAKTFGIKKVRHISGLPIPEGTMTNLFYTWDNFQMSVDGANYNVESNRIMGAVYKKKKELINISRSSSIGKAALGGILLGPIGIALGGMKDTHKDYKESYVLAISYISENEAKYLIFETDNWKAEIDKLCSFIQNEREKATLDVKL
ncbi:hypothetical protein HMPREF1143_0494 [Peptoanaerobacter stomatis]|uniref:Uncharacterized protein n=1 Tax=Peptoanaerobacter stomatis TaxID=796937 RepID=J6HK34_9FIRM|nr:hypothetical protein [Peptoanaerobacter stomatis]EJU22973.1 hypothetical protein HMPREF1143_0494 [Peptoanaerobacter stomatis]